MARYRNRELAHAWFYGQTYNGKGSNFWFEDGSIYSYRTIMAKKTTGVNGQSYTLVNEEYYSVTTSKHQSYIQEAIDRNETTVINIHEAGVGFVTEITPSNLSDYIKESQYHMVDMSNRLPGLIADIERRRAPHTIRHAAVVLRKKCCDIISFRNFSGVDIPDVVAKRVRQASAMAAEAERKIRRGRKENQSHRRQEEGIIMTITPLQTLKDSLRFVADIGMFAIDRGKGSCRWATDYCKEHCYNNKLYKVYPAMTARDYKNTVAWEKLREGPYLLRLALEYRRKPTDRFRFCTRGEPLKAPRDLEMIEAIAHDHVVHGVKRLFWIPTRAWRSPALRHELEGRRKEWNDLGIRLQASIDPSNTADEIADLHEAGWSTMFFGDNSETAGRHRCAKTWQGAKGACAVCAAGCFSPNQMHIHLKKH